MIKIGSLLLLLSQILFSFVQSSVDKNVFTSGESITFTITAQGKDIQFPQIDSISRYRIGGVSTSSNLSFMNGVKITKMSKSFSFSPDRSLVIPSYQVMVNGNLEQTAPISIKLSNRPSKINGFSLEIVLDKKELFLFEHTTMKVIFKRNQSLRFDDLKLNIPSLDNFWHKQIGKETTYQRGNDVFYELKYVISPQKIGNLTLSNFFVNIGTQARRNNGFWFGNNLTYKKVFAPKVNIAVKDIPNNLLLVGDFKLEAYTDKKSANSNEPVNLTIKISGMGNFEDIPSFELNIPNVSMYSNPPVKTIDEKSGFFEQKFAMVAGSDYKIEPIELTFFSLKDNKQKTMKTKPFSIKIIATKTANQPQIKTNKNTNINTQDKDIQNSNMQKLLSKDVLINYFLFFILGFILALILVKMLSKNTNWSIKNCVCVSIFKSIFAKKIRDKNALKILLSSPNQDEVTNGFIVLLEKKIYKNEVVDIDYRKLKKIIEQINEKGL